MEYENLTVFDNIPNEVTITNEEKKILTNYIKVFLVPFAANKFTRSYAVHDLIVKSSELLGFKIGTKDFLEAMYNENFPLRPASNLSIIGYYKVKANYYDLAYRLYSQLKKYDLKITIVKLS